MLPALSGRPSIGLTCESIARRADAVMNPLSAGRERKRTRPDSRHTPMRVRMTPTRIVRNGAMRERSSTESPCSTSTSPTRRQIRAPVPMDEWMHVPNTA